MIVGSGKMDVVFHEVVTSSHVVGEPLAYLCFGHFTLPHVERLFEF